MVMNWTLQLLSHNLVFLFHLISLGKRTSIPLLNIAKHARFPCQSPWVFLIFSPSIYIQVPNLSFFRVLLPRLGWCSKTYSMSSRQSPVQSHSQKSSFIPRTGNLWNVLPSCCFPESYNLPSFKSKINKLDLISLSS